MWLNKAWQSPMSIVMLVVLVTLYLVTLYLEAIVLAWGIFDISWLSVHLFAFGILETSALFNTIFSIFTVYFNSLTKTCY